MNALETMSNERRPPHPTTSSDETSARIGDAWEEREQPQEAPVQRDGNPHRRSWFAFDRWLVLADQEDDFVLA